MNYMDKIASELTPYLADNDRGRFKHAFEMAAGRYIKTRVQEDAWSERLFPPISVGAEDLIADDKTDTFYYQEEIENDYAEAVESSYRMQDEPAFVDGKRYRIRISKLRTKPVKKQEIELLVAKNLVNFIKNNAADELRRLKDAKMKYLIDLAVNRTGNIVTTDDNYIQKEHLVELLGLLIKERRDTANLLMSAAAWNNLNKWDQVEWGDEVANKTVNGIQEHKLLNTNIIVTINGIDQALTDYGTWAARTTFGCNFDAYSGGEFNQTSIYGVGDQDYLGRNLRFGDVRVEAKWDADIFSYQTWEYAGIGFGDIRALAKLNMNSMAS